MKLLICAFAIATFVHGTIDVHAQKPDSTGFAVGQVWSYRARPIDDRSVLVIVKIEKDPKLGVIVHVALDQVYLRGVNGPAMTIAHMPFAEKALRQSVLELVGEATELPDWEEGYKSWRDSFDAKAAGIYDITVAEAVEITADSLNPR